MYKEITIDTTALRAALRSKRRALSDMTQAEHSQAILQYLQSFPAFMTARSIGAYAAFDGEINLDPIIAHCHAMEQALYLPHIIDKTQLHFLPYTPNTPLHPNHFGIAEPRSQAAPHTPELLLVPLVAFDAQGHRLGMGGGYYDRWLASAHPRPTTIGIAHAFQEVEALVPNVWDMPLEKILTEKGWITLHS